MADFKIPGAGFFGYTERTTTPAFILDTIFTPNRAAPFFVGMRGADAKFGLVEHFKPNQAAEFHTGSRIGNLYPRPPKQGWAHLFNITEAAQFTIEGVQPLFGKNRLFRTVAAGGLFPNIGDASFDMDGSPDEFAVTAATMIGARPPQPSFIMANGSDLATFDAARFTMTAQQAEYEMRSPYSPRFDVQQAALIGIAAAQPRFARMTLMSNPPPVYPFLADGAVPTAIRYGYKTDVQTFDSLAERRRTVRTVPSGSLRVSMAHLTPAEAQRANALLHSGQGGQFIVPLAIRRMVALADSAVNDYFAIVDTTNVRLFADQYALIYSDSSDWELNVISDWDSENVNFYYPIKKVRKAGTWKVIPCVVGRLSSEESFVWKSRDFATEAREFKVKRWES